MTLEVVFTQALPQQTWPCGHVTHVPPQHNSPDEQKQPLETQLPAPSQVEFVPQEVPVGTGCLAQTPFVQLKLRQGVAAPQSAGTVQPPGAGDPAANAGLSALNSTGAVHATAAPAPSRLSAVRREIPFGVPSFSIFQTSQSFWPTLVR
jgi:hypothetical protein